MRRDGIEIWIDHDLVRLGTKELHTTLNSQQMAHCAQIIVRGMEGELRTIPITVWTYNNCIRPSMYVLINKHSARDTAGASGADTLS